MELTPDHPARSPHPWYDSTPRAPHPTPSLRSPPSTWPGAACAPHTTAAAQLAGRAVAAAVPGPPGTEVPGTAALLPSQTVAAAARPMCSEPCGPPLGSLKASQRHPPPRTTCRVVKGMHGVTQELLMSYLSNSCPRRRTPPVPPARDVLPYSNSPIHAIACPPLRTPAFISSCSPHSLSLAYSPVDPAISHSHSPHSH